MQTLILQVWVGPTFLKFPGDTVHLPEVYTLRSKALVNHNGLLTVSGEGNGTPLQYSCLENPMDGGAWWATVHGVAKSRTRLSNLAAAAAAAATVLTTLCIFFHLTDKQPKRQVCL